MKRSISHDHSLSVRPETSNEPMTDQCCTFQDSPTGDRMDKEPPLCGGVRRIWCQAHVQQVNQNSPRPHQGVFLELRCHMTHFPRSLASSRPPATRRTHAPLSMLRARRTQVGHVRFLAAPRQRSPASRYLIIDNTMAVHSSSSKRSASTSMT